MVAKKPMKKVTPTPKKAAQEAIAFMKSHSIPERVETLQRYFKDPIQAYGMDYPAYKIWIKEFVARLKESWTLNEAVAFCDTMVKDPHLEARGVGFHVVGAFVDEAAPEFLTHPHRWLETVCDNWGSVDGLASAVTSPFLRMYPELVEDVKGWTSSPNQWVRRGAPVTLVPLMDNEEVMTAGYEVATSLLDDKEDLIHKAVGWMLREAGKVDRDRLEAYLLEKGPQTPRTTLRYAIEKFPKEDRKRLMAATKG
jgi:3-methyladenine DNA glycosylase AlkD